MTFKKFFLIILGSFFLLGLTNHCSAAKLYLVSEGKSFAIGQEFEVDIKVNTEEVGINAAEAALVFTNNVLELLAVEKEGSTFNFWLEGPNISNGNGEMKFIGGTPKGVSGSALQILKMKFKATGAGVSNITFRDAVVTASDGKGTNILSTVEGLSIRVVTTVVSPGAPPEPEPEPEPAPTKPQPAPIEQPKPVVREPIITQNLPQKPVLTVPLYPDSSKWYSHLGEVIVFWEVPDDVVKTGARVDQNPRGNTWSQEDIENMLFTGKKFGTLKEGTWYVHTQFKNNIGWSETTHYKISLDTTPPLPFEIAIDNDVSDNPSPVINYETHDSLSGIAQYLIFIDGKGPTLENSVTAILPAQAPGKHTVTVRAVDLAGNGVEDNLDFEILPLPLPLISFMTKSVAQEEFIFASGKTITNGLIDVRILNKAGHEVFLGETNSDELGNWEIIIEESMARGSYTLTINARDERGAISFPVSESLTIKAKTIFSLGFVELSWFEIFLIVLLLVISAVSVGAWYYVSLKKRRTAYKMVASRDTNKLIKLLAEDLNGLEGWLKQSKEGFEKRAQSEMEFHLGNMRDTIGKMKKYLNRELDKLR